jgi:hypothetical protein
VKVATIYFKDIYNIYADRGQIKHPVCPFPYSFLKEEEDKSRRGKDRDGLTKLTFFSKVGSNFIRLIQCEDFFQESKIKLYT